MKPKAYMMSDIVEIKGKWSEKEVRNLKKWIKKSALNVSKMNEQTAFEQSKEIQKMAHVSLEKLKEPFTFSL